MGFQLHGPLGLNNLERQCCDSTKLSVGLYFKQLQIERKSASLCNQIKRTGLENFYNGAIMILVYIINVLKLQILLDWVRKIFIHFKSKS